MFTFALLDTLQLALTRLGSLTTLLPAMLIASLLLWRVNHREIAQLLGCSLCLSAILARLLKLLFRCPRPLAADLLISMPTDWSFPSAHAAQATAFFLVLAILGKRTLPTIQAHTTALICGLLAAGVGFSRLYLRVHSFADVLAGTLLAGVLCLMLTKVWPAPLVSP